MTTAIQTRCMLNCRNKLLHTVRWVLQTFSPSRSDWGYLCQAAVFIQLLNAVFAHMACTVSVHRRCLAPFLVWCPFCPCHMSWLCNLIIHKLQHQNCIHISARLVLVNIVSVVRVCLSGMVLTISVKECDLGSTGAETHQHSSAVQTEWRTRAKTSHLQCEENKT